MKKKVLAIVLGLLPGLSSGVEKAVEGPIDLKVLDNCIKRIEQLCPKGKSSTNCTQVKWKRLPSNCQQYSGLATSFGTKGSVSRSFDGPSLDCFNQIQKLCTLDEKLALRNFNQAATQYQNCLDKSISKLKGKCKTLLSTGGQRKPTGNAQ